MPTSPQEHLWDRAAADAQRLCLGASLPQKKFMLLCSSSISGIMVNHNTHLAPGFTLNVFVLAPENVVVLQGPLGPFPVGVPHSLYQISSQQGNHLSVWPKDLLVLSLCFWGFALPTRAPPGIELWGFRPCTLPVYRVLMEFKPSPFSLFSSVPVAVSTFPLSLQLLCGGHFSCILPPHTFAVLSPHAKAAPYSPRLLAPKVTSLHRIPAEFCGSGCADCCVNPPVSFLGV